VKELEFDFDCHPDASYDIKRAALIRFLRETVVPAIVVDDYGTLKIRVYTEVHYSVDVHSTFSHIKVDKHVLVINGFDTERTEYYFELVFAGQYATEVLM